MDRLIGMVAPGDAALLASVEDTVWARVDELGRDGAQAGRVRAAAVAIALVMGVTNGGLMFLTSRPEPSEMRIFTVSGGLSPLASLDVRG